MAASGVLSSPKKGKHSKHQHSLPNFRNATASDWLSCSSKEGWGPLLAKYSDLTPCFVQGVMTGLCALFMVIFGTYQIITLRQRKQSSNRVNWVFYSKLTLVSLQLIFLFALIIHDLGGASIIQLALLSNFVAQLVALGLHYIEQFKAEIPNGILLFYWLFQGIIGFLTFFSLKLRNQLNSTESHIGILATVNALLILFLELYFPMKSSKSYIKQLDESPYDKADVFSRITFAWMAPLMKKGYEQFLTEDDLPALPRALRAESTSERFYHFWNRQAVNHKSLVKAVAQAFGSPFIIAGVFKGLQDLLGFVQPQLLRLLIQFVNDYANSLKEGEPITLTRGLMLSVGMFLVGLTQTGFLHQYFQRVFDLGMKIKTALTSAVYNKLLVLSNESKQESSTGDIVNLMSVDVQRLQDLVQNLQIVWSGPFQIIVCLYSLHGLVGNSMWAGFCVMLIMIPINAIMARYLKNLQRTQMKYKDERSRLTSEILNNIKSLKLYGWETPYLERLQHVRNDKELSNLKKMCVLGAFTFFSWNLAPFLVSCSTFACYILFEKKSLTTDIVFPALALFNMLSFPLAVIPMVITNIVEAQVAVSRLTKFLTAGELQDDAVIRLPKATRDGETAVSIKNGTFLWSKSTKDENYKVALSNINLDSKKGELDCIVGKVGSGKSLIIQAALGDLYKLDGEVKIRGKVAYVAQVPWIMNGSVKENVLFGHKYDPEYYDKVMKACALNVDLKILPKGDRTEVGEKGISLSGGQKARLSLARAVYARADVYLLDDPLSAVDEHVGRHLIDHVLGPNGILKSKCKVLATNNIGVLSLANNLLMVSDGRLIERGTYSEIMTQENSKLYQLIKEFGRKQVEKQQEEGKKAEDDQDEEEKDAVDPDNLDSDCDFDIQSLRRASDASINAETMELLRVQSHDDEAKARKEHLEQGKVKWSVYLAYAKACNERNVGIFFFTTVVSTFLSVMANVWLKHWSEINTRKGYNPHVGKYLGIYFLLGICYSASSLFQSLFMNIVCSIRGSRVLHDNMALRVLRAPMSFFETTPIGRILNRFSNDVYKVDEILARTFGMFFNNATRVMFTIVVICISTWQFIFVIIPLVFFYVYYQQYYMSSSRELKRLDSVTRSPIYANFQESLVGVATIRAYGKDERFMRLNALRVDKNMRAQYPAINCNRWLAVRLETLGSIIILASSGLAILTLKSGHVSAGMVGLSVSYALLITQSLNWIVRMTVEVETNIVSVERILEYSELNVEAAEVIEDNRPPTSWPSEGAITFRDYSAKYRPELDLVLKHIDLDIKPREKIGIVGRTGAGKSSITLGLFRIIEKFGGDIVIDGIETSSIGLGDLRHKLSIIPQDSQVFEGSIRSNLDPTDEYTDEAIWKALELSHLKSHVETMYENTEEKESLKSPLDVRISEGGSNLSIGQRQLMCLGRVLLKMNTTNILVLDEATAAVDVETDKILQETIRKEFKEKTIITIAHRLNTILDSDRIIVLEKGEVAEFDSPQNLLKNKDSLFYSLAKQGGFTD